MTLIVWLVSCFDNFEPFHDEYGCGFCYQTVAAICHFPSVRAAVEATVSILQACIPVARIGQRTLCRVTFILMSLPLLALFLFSDIFYLDFMKLGVGVPSP